MAKNWHNVTVESKDSDIINIFNCNVTTSQESEREFNRRITRFNDLIRRTESISLENIKTRHQQMYDAMIAEEDHLLDAVSNKRCTNPALVEKAKAISKRRAEEEKKKANKKNNQE